MEVNGELQAPAPLPPRKEPPVPIGYEAQLLKVSYRQPYKTFVSHYLYA